MLNAVDWAEAHRKAIAVTLIPTIALMMIGVYFLVIKTGGIRFVFSHSMYFPIALAAISFGIRGGILSAIIGGFILGPLTQLDTITNEAQLTINWVYRMGFFTLIGVLVGTASDTIRFHLTNLRWDSLHDKSTNLLNRSALKNSIRKLTDQADHNQSHFLIIYSLANANEVVDHFGHDALETLILQIAQRVQTKLRPGVNTYRTQEHLVCVLLENFEKHKIDGFVESTRKHLLEPLVFNNINLHGDIYTGILELKGVRETPTFYVNRVSRVVSQAIEINKQVLSASSDEVDNKISKNIELLGNLKIAIESRHLLMHYQPKLNLIDGKVLSAESLMRWNHPKLGFIAPNKFIPRAERSSLIDNITHFALDQSLLQVASWKKANKKIKVAVNISARNLSQPNFVYNVLSLLDRHELDGSYLELELTESALMNDEDHVVTALKILSKKGITISIDDYGTGYSSLHYLQRLPISIIKIDQSFIFEMHKDINKNSTYIVESTINLAHQLGMQVVAEGVEDQATLQLLIEMGCDMAQGYHIARPTSAEEFEIWHSMHEAKH